jgi:hypothetical protein
MGLLSGLFGASEADQARELQQKQINAQYKYNKQKYEYDNQQALREYEFRKQGLKIDKKNEKALINFNYQTNLQNAQYQQAIQNYTYESQLRQYRKSEQIYKQQLGFNELAAYRAASSEARRMQDVVADQAYQKQDLFLGLLEAEGMQMARGVSGKSVGKGLQSAIAQYGRNQAILADSMLSANKEYQNNLADIRLSKYGADLAADANRMLEPLRLPNVPMPMKQPRSKFQDPLRPVAPPKPIKGANTVPGGNYAGAIAGGLASAGVGLATAAMSGPLTPLAIGGALLGIL